MPDIRPTKEEAACCQAVAAKDRFGRPPIGFCGPNCERRPASGPLARKAPQGERLRPLADRAVAEQDAWERSRARAAEALA